MVELAHRDQPTEAVALAFNLEEAETPRPMTYAMVGQLVAASGSRVTGVRITTLAESTLYAVIDVDGRAGPQEVDARPSDALNVALVCGAPILVRGDVLSSLETNTRWETFPTGADALVADRQRRRGELMAAAEEWATGGTGGAGT